MPLLPSTLLSSDGSTPATAAAGILGLGAHLPDGIISNADLEALVQTSHSWILERTGIVERRRAGSGETVSVMAALAGEQALRAAGIERPDAIIVSTCTPDTLVPPAACLVQRRLGLEGIPAFDVNGACSGWMYGLILAEGLVRSGTAATVLLIGAEALTTLVDYTDRSTCVLFGDGAGAAVVGGSGQGGIVARRWAADGAEADLIYLGPVPGDPESGAHLRMAGKGTFRNAVERLAETGRQLCADAGWDTGDVDLVVPHQANQRIIEAAAKRIGIPMERVVVNVDRTGNTSSASIPLALAEVQAAGRLTGGMRVLLLAFGAGSTWGGVALQWIEPAAS